MFDARQRTPPTVRHELQKTADDVGKAHPTTYRLPEAQPTNEDCHMLRTSLAGLCLTFLFIAVASKSACGVEAPWARFRGPDGLGHTGQSDIPTEWDAGDITWRSQLAGQGHSSVCVWGERLFLTAARVMGDQVERLVICLDRETGSEVWQQTASRGEMESLHKMNSFATPTCTCDGQRVVAFFGRGGLHCYDLDGKRLWSRDLGSFPGPWGTGASPIIVGDLVIQNCDAQGPSSLLAVNKMTGQTVWKADRGQRPRGGWNTPLLIDTGSRRELILNGEYGVRGYDPTTGRELWFCKSASGRGTPIPAHAKGTLYVVSGLPGEIYAVLAGGEGDVTNTRTVWRTARRGGRDIPSPILVDRYLLVSNMAGIGTCYDATDGSELWRERLEGNYSASPIAVNGLIYLQNESGETLVIKPGPTLQVVARNELGSGAGEIFRSTMAPSAGQLFFRSNTHVYCVGTRVDR